MRALAIAIVMAMTVVARAEPAPGSPRVGQRDGQKDGPKGGQASGPKDGQASGQNDGPKDAKPEGPSEAAQLFARARELAKQEQFAEACALFEQSYRLEPAMGTAVNLAACFEREGKLRRAWELYDVVARGESTVQSRARLARERADQLAARLATVVIRIGAPDTPGLRVALGERPLALAGEVRERVDPGAIELEATAPGRTAWRRSIAAAAGASITVDVPALAEPPGELRRRRSRVYLAGGLGAAGAASLGVSLGLAIASRSAYDRAFSRGCSRTPDGVVCLAASEGAALVDTAGRRADLATGFAIGGAIAAGVAAAVFFTAPTERVQVAPLARADAVGVTLAGRF